MRSGLRALSAWLAAAALALALFQCWYAYLPPEEAARFDLCRFGPAVDCWKTLNTYGAELEILGGLPVLPALAGVAFLQLALLLLARAAGEAAGEALGAIAGMASFPVSGLALYELMIDLVGTEATSASTLGLVALGLALNALAVMRGFRCVRLAPGLRATAAAAAAALLLALFLNGAGRARREIELALREAQAAPPQVRWADFAPDFPRAGMPRLGEPTAPHEVLLFVDPGEERSRAVLRDLVELIPRYADQVTVIVCAPGDAGRRLLAAARDGRLESALADPASLPDPGADRDLDVLFERQVEAQTKLAITVFPTALWAKGRESGEFSLLAVLDAARRG